MQYAVPVFIEAASSSSPSYSSSSSPQMADIISARSNHQQLPAGASSSVGSRELFLGASSLQRYLQPLQLDGSCRRLSAATTAAQGIDDAQAEVEEDPESSVDGPSPFALFDSPELSRFVNMLMQEGKKQTARTILWKAFGRLRRGGHDPREVFETVHVDEHLVECINDHCTVMECDAYQK